MENVDNEVKEQLISCISSEKRNSFFLFAGAGSGKTYTLVELLKNIRELWGKKLAMENRKVAVITYTNAATDEIRSRGNFGTLFHISTIHSFLWDIIQPYQKEIKRLYLEYMDIDIKNLSDRQKTTANKKTKTYLKNADRLERLQERRNAKAKIDKFVYNPNGDNLQANSLNHQDVINIGNDMICQHPLLRQILSQQYPFILIDESQDTKGKLVDAFFKIQQECPKNFTLGFIGDIKQRIYMDGKENIKGAIPKTWLQPQKQMNYRCDRRIIELANKIAEGIDGSKQVPRKTAKEGFVHLFLIPTDVDKIKTEQEVCDEMNRITGDEGWNVEKQNVEILTLEHRMAATRLGFEKLHDIFNGCKRYQMSYLQGTMPEMSIFSNAILPLFELIKEGKNFEILDIFKRNSPLMESVPKTDYVKRLHEIKEKIEILKEYDIEKVTAKAIMEFVKDNNLFRIPDLIDDALEERETEDDETVLAWESALNLTLFEYKAYDDYVNDRTMYATHQGVKGLEFSRVLVLIDDKDAKGKLFNYERLFEVEPLSKTDEKNIEEGRETSIDRTLRLLYVTCTRAKHSLALLMYTANPEKAKATALAKGWFNNDEISIMA